jgi:hypothetical protein
MPGPKILNGPGTIGCGSPRSRDGLLAERSSIPAEALDKETPLWQSLSRILCRVSSPTGVAYRDGWATQASERWLVTPECTRRSEPGSRITCSELQPLRHHNHDAVDNVVQFRCRPARNPYVRSVAVVPEALTAALAAEASSAFADHHASHPDHGDLPSG